MPETSRPSRPAFVEVSMNLVAKKILEARHAELGDDFSKIHVSGRKLTSPDETGPLRSGFSVWAFKIFGTTTAYDDLHIMVDGSGGYEAFLPGLETDLPQPFCSGHLSEFTPIQPPENPSDLRRTSPDTAQSTGSPFSPCSLQTP